MPNGITPKRRGLAKGLFEFLGGEVPSEPATEMLLGEIPVGPPGAAFRLGSVIGKGSLDDLMKQATEILDRMATRQVDDLTQQLFRLNTQIKDLERGLGKVPRALVDKRNEVAELIRKAGGNVPKFRGELAKPLTLKEIGTPQSTADLATAVAIDASTSALKDFSRQQAEQRGFPDPLAFTQPEFQEMILDDILGFLGGSQR